MAVVCDKCGKRITEGITIRKALLCDKCIFDLDTWLGTAKKKKGLFESVLDKALQIP